VNKDNKSVNKKENQNKPMTKEEAEALVAGLSTCGVGKYVLAWANSGKTNLILKDINKYSFDPLLKMFCISWDEVNMDGLVLAKIESFRVDKKNNVYIVVKPMLSLNDAKHLFVSAVWEFFIECGVMWKPYNRKRDVVHEHFNVAEAYRKLGYEKGEDETATRVSMWNDMIDGKFSFNALSQALNTANTYEKDASRLYKMWRNKRLFMYPMLKARLDRENFKEKQMVEFLKKESEAYARLGLTGTEDSIEKAEAVMLHYNEMHNKQKEEAKAAKKGC